MADIKTTIRGLECCSGAAIFESKCRFDCPYYHITNPFVEDCCERLIKDALALLKEKEPKLLTLEEMEKTEEWMWVEYVSGYCGWQCQDKEDNYLNMVAWNDSTFDRKDYYGKTWRCWNARPTEEQRKAVKWE